MGSTLGLGLGLGFGLGGEYQPEGGEEREMPRGHGGVKDGGVKRR